MSDMSPEERLAQLLDGAAAEDEGELAELALLALVVGDLTPPPAPAAFRDELRARLIERATPLAVTKPLRERIEAWGRSARLATASALVAALVASSATVVAAQQALPGSTLYGVKSATESARLALASGPASTGRVQLALAAERLDEVRRGAGALPAHLLLDTLARMDAATEQGAAALREAALTDPALLEELARFAQTQGATLAATIAELPAVVRHAAERSLARLREHGWEPTAAPDPGGQDVPVATPTGGTPEEGEPGGEAEDAQPAGPRGEDDDVPPAEPGGRVLVPRLPEPLDDAGQQVDDLLSRLVDELVDDPSVPDLPESPLP